MILARWELPQKLTEPLVQATIEVFQEVTKALLPTPAKSHYTFNMREIWKVFQGLSFLSPKAIKDSQAVKSPFASSVLLEGTRGVLC